MQMTHGVKMHSFKKYIINRVSKKKQSKLFCRNFVKCLPTLILFGTKMANTIEFCKVHSFSILRNLCQRRCF